MALPSLSLAFLLMGGFVRLIRASMLETLREDYIRTVRAAGVGHWRIIVKHALPNALVPFVTALGLSLANLLTGAVVIEAIFMWPGMGSYILDAAAALDFPAIMGFTVIAAVIYVLANFAVDLVYLRLDPAQERRLS
ncbi:MAG: ABC transporter permease [Caldilinea sp. CFX5]|nr:ABC transporter permease [Caldilinea sp. CFX5]